MEKLDEQITITELKKLINNEIITTAAQEEEDLDDSSDHYLQSITLLHNLKIKIENSPNIFCSEFYQLLVKIYEVCIYTTYNFEPAPIYEIDMEEDETFITNKIAQRIATIEFIIVAIDNNNFLIDQAKKFFNIQFICKVLNSFYCPEPREREMSKTLLHKIYTKFIGHRSKIRNRIKIMLQEIVATKAYCRGIPQILDILSSIISGFAKPIKDEHKSLLKDGLTILLKMPNLSQFDQKLSLSLLYFCEKDSDCLDIVLDSMLKYWPKTAPNKEQKFIFYLNEILNVCDEKNLVKNKHRIISQICRCLKSDHCQLIEQTLKLLFENQQMLKIIELDPENYLRQIINCRPNVQPGDWNGTLICYFKELEDLYAKKFGKAYYNAIS